MSDKPLKIGDVILHSRLWVGTARYPSPHILLKALEAANAQVVTVSVRRISFDKPQENFLSALLQKPYLLLPNTAGCYTAEEAIYLAELAREALQTNWIKVEVIGDDYTLWPDAVELIKACEELIRRGFTVLAYAPDDPIVCKRLWEMGCAAVMPLASPIGSGLGAMSVRHLELIRALMPDATLVVDAGIGAPSDAALVMEMGYDAVLVNTAIAQAEDPIRMAKAMAQATQAGREAFLAGRIPKSLSARPSSPLEGIPR
ncbi:MAG: thiazole synthase [Bacteroidia bacterium]